MAISQAQIRKDARLNIAYENNIRTTAPLGKIGNLGMTISGSPKARMPGLFERFSIFWKAVFRARSIEKGSDVAWRANFEADQHRVRKYTGELFGKLQREFVEGGTESGHDKVLLGIRKTMGKLDRIRCKYHQNKNEEIIRQKFYDAMAEIRKNRSDSSVVRSGLEYLIFERKSAMMKLSQEERKTLHAIALLAGVSDKDMQGVLYFHKQDDSYSYSPDKDNFEPLDERLNEILLLSDEEDVQIESTPIFTGSPDDSDQSKISPSGN